ncbi:TPA: hypothetical protein H1Q11_002162 [Salmonella enterica]|nr:hypothetical protein [Salmonella enterica]
MFKLLITLINHETGDRRQLVHNGRYRTSDEAYKDARKMAYVHRDINGNITHECTVKITGVDDV